MAWLDSVDSWSRLNTLSRMMAVSETVAHLRLLENMGRVRVHENGTRQLEWEPVS